MEDPSAEILSTVREIRDLIRLLAEPAIAARDKKLRGELRQAVGSSKPKGKSVLMMDGTRTQTEIHTATGVNQGHLSTLVKQMTKLGLLVGDGKKPKLAISVPATFFEEGAGDE